MKTKRLTSLAATPRLRARRLQSAALAAFVCGGIAFVPARAATDGNAAASARSTEATIAVTSSKGHRVSPYAVANRKHALAAPSGSAPVSRLSTRPHRLTGMSQR